jgi:hypothetical protein
VWGSLKDADNLTQEQGEKVLLDDVRQEAGTLRVFLTTLGEHL